MCVRVCVFFWDFRIATEILRVHYKLEIKCVDIYALGNVPMQDCICIHACMNVVIICGIHCHQNAFQEPSIPYFILQTMKRSFPDIGGFNHGFTI